MNSVSQGKWPTKTLGEVATVVNGGTPKSRVAEYWGGSVQWLTPKDMGRMDGREIERTPRTITDSGLGNSSARLIPANSIILSTRAPIGHLAINSVPMAFNQGCRGLVPKEGLDHVFLYYFLYTNREILQELGTGTTFKELSSSNLKSVPIILPPLAEQQRIVAVLDEAFEGLDRARANAEANLHNANELFENVVDEAFAENKWRVTELEKIVHDECSLSYGIVQPGDEVLGGLPIVRPTDMTKRIIDLDGLKRIDPNKAASYKRTTLVGGELLVCVRGTTGTVSIANKKLSGANVTRGIVPIRFDPSKINTWFAYFQFRSKYVTDQIEEKTYGAALMQINIRDIRKLNILYPSLQEQCSVANKLESVSQNYDRIFKEISTKLSAISDLRQSLLQRAFAGELT